MVLIRRLTSNRVISASLLIAFFFGVDKVVALVRQQIVGRSFGLNATLDAYNVANNLPDLLFGLISGSALGIAFIPVLTEVLDKEGRSGAWKLFSQVVNLAFIVTGLFSIVIALFPMFFIQRVITPGFPLEQQLLVANLMRLNLIATLLFSISGLVMGGLQANQHFLLPALAPTFYNVGQIVGVLVFGKALGIYGLAFGVILGAVLHLGIQIPGLIRYEFKWTPRIDLNDPGVRKMLRLMAPRVLTLFFIYLTLSIARDNIASRLIQSGQAAPGSISALDYGWYLLQLPETLIGTAIATALLPTLSELVARKERDELKQLLRRSLGILVVITVPAAILGYLLLPVAVKLVFEGRAFTAENSALVILAARMFMLGLLGHSLKEITARAFYAHQDAYTPMFLAILTLALFVAFSLAFAPMLGFASLALANSLAFTVEALLMLFILYRRRII
jgi:putative peptidoglycan lipid II flippase